MIEYLVYSSRILTNARNTSWRNNAVPWINIGSWNNAQVRARGILNLSNSDNILDQAYQMVIESARKQIYQLGLVQSERQELEDLFMSRIKDFVQFLPNNQGSVPNDNRTRWYLHSADIWDTEDVKNFLEKTFFNTENTHIGIYLWRIRDNNELINTINHEINHLFLRYRVFKNTAMQKWSDVNRVFNDVKFKTILECFGFLSWAETAIITWWSMLDWLKLAGAWSNGDLSNIYSKASIMAQRLLLIQMTFGNKAWSSHPEFITYCQRYRFRLTYAIYDTSTFNELVQILWVDSNNDFSVTDDVLLRMIDWTEK